MVTWHNRGVVWKTDICMRPIYLAHGERSCTWRKSPLKCVESRVKVMRKFPGQANHATNACSKKRNRNQGCFFDTANRQCLCGFPQDSLGRNNRNGFLQSQSSTNPCKPL